MNINIFILEDNYYDYNMLKIILSKWAECNGNIIHTHHFVNGNELLKSDNISACHLLFSDINVPASKNTFTQKSKADTDDVFSENGIEICSQLRKKGFKGDIIFLTAYKEYVFHGYSVRAANYLLKPINPSQINKCMNQYVSLHAPDFYYLHDDGKIIQIPYNNIIAITRLGHDCIINSIEQNYSERTSLNTIESRLPSQFIRCHKSCIVNINHVRSFSGSLLYLSNNTNQTIGRNYIPKTKSALMELIADSFRDL